MSTGVYFCLSFTRSSLCLPSLTHFPIPPLAHRTHAPSTQDKTDDVKMGIRSTALLFGEHTRSVLSALSVTSVGLIGTAGYLTDTLLTGVVGVPFYTGLGVGALQLARVLRQTDFNDRASCWKGFVGCGWSGFWIWIGAVGNCLYLMF